MVRGGGERKEGKNYSARIDGMDAVFIEFEKRKTGARVPEPRAPGKVVMGDQWMEGDG